MENNLTIITVSARSANLIYLYNNIIEQKPLWKGNLKWEIIFDYVDESSISPIILNLLNENKKWINYQFLPNIANKVSGGNHGKNVLIKQIKNGWIYQLDDDNLLYPNFLKLINDLVNDRPEVNLFCFWQHLRFHPKSIDDLKAGIVDTAMYFFKKDIAENIEYPLHYGGDGEFLEKLVKNPLTNLYIKEKILCWYNQLSFIKDDSFIEKLTNNNEIDTDSKQKILSWYEQISNLNKPMNELSKLALKYGTDKFSRHNYCDVYFELFKQYKDKPINFLELGIYYGHSLQMWREWFSQAKIIGVDITIPNIDIPNVEMYTANTQTIEICDILKWEQFDIIIDDADHHPYSQLKTLWNVWPLLKSGGIYIIEDIQNFDGWGKHWNFFDYQIFDQRTNGGTYDSVLLMIKKS